MLVEPAQTFHLYRVCWSSVIGPASGQGEPLPRDEAEFIAHDEALAHPLRRYWVEEYDAESDDE